MASHQRGEEMVHITARVPATLARAFEEVAAAEDRSVSAELRRAMRAHLQSLDSQSEDRGKADSSG